MIIIDPTPDNYSHYNYTTDINNNHNLDYEINEIMIIKPDHIHHDN